MKKQNVAGLLKVIGGILLALAIFLTLSVSDVVRLNPDLADTPNGHLAAKAKDTKTSTTMNVLVPDVELVEGMQRDFSAGVEPHAAPETLQEKTIGSKDYIILSEADFQSFGGKFDKDKMADYAKTLEDEGVTYATGKVTFVKELWPSLSGWAVFLLTIAPVLTAAIVIGALVLVAGLALGLMDMLATRKQTLGQYLAEVFNPRKVGKFILNNVIIIMIVLFAIVVGVMRPNFFSVDSIRNLASNTAVRFIIALGVSGCLITKGTDLSAGRVAGFAACLSAILLQRGDYGAKFYPNMGELPILVVLAIVLGICAIIGIINGSVISIFKVPPFIATLGMQTLVYGICLVYTGASPIGGLRADYTNLATGYVGNRIFSYILIIAMCIGLFMWFLYNKTRHGKYMYAIGGNEIAAEVAGINTTKSKILIYMLAAILYGVMGFLSAAKSGGASVNTAQGYELEAIAGCTIGGVSVNGGVGKISGILIGVLVFEVLKVALQFLGVESSYTYIVQGLVIIVAVALDLRKYLAKK